MNPAESIIYTLWRGIAIGILISAPMGPVGILCIQRTLDKGRRTGLFTGIGASLSDLFYCLLTGFGLSFIEEFLERNQNIIQLIGSAVLIAFGVYLFKKNPAGTLRSPSQPRGSDKKNILGGFLFTFSNPLILFLIIGLFARFNFLTPELPWVSYVVGYIAIFIGAFIWWWIVTFFIDKVRNHFNLRSMWLINRIIATVILLFALVGITTGIINLTSQDAAAANSQKATGTFLNRARGFNPLSKPDDAITDGTLTITSLYDRPEYRMLKTPDVINVNDSIDLIEFRFRLKDTRKFHKTYHYTDSQGRKSTVHNPGWILKAVNHDSDLSLEFHTCSDHNLLSDAATLNVALFIDSVCKNSISLKSGINPEGENSYLIQLTPNSLRVFTGNRKLSKIIDTDIHFMPDSIGFEIPPGGEITISDISLTATTTQRKPVSFCPETQGNNTWVLLDSSLENTLMLLGGDYHLLEQEESDGSISFLYLSGAQTEANKWKPGMIKLRLLPTGLTDIYDAQWYDAEGHCLQHGIKAQKESPSTLRIMFPYHNSRLRLQRIDRN